MYVLYVIKTVKRHGVWMLSLENWIVGYLEKSDGDGVTEVLQRQSVSKCVPEAILLCGRLLCIFIYTCYTATDIR